jgi:hypothetical protein
LTILQNGLFHSGLLIGPVLHFRADSIAPGTGCFLLIGGVALSFIRVVRQVAGPGRVNALCGNSTNVMVRFLRNFPWKQANWIALGFLVWLVIAPFLDERRNK